MIKICSLATDGGQHRYINYICIFCGYKLEQEIEEELKATDMLLNKEEAKSIISLVYHSYIPYDTPEGIEMHKLITRLEKFLE